MKKIFHDLYLFISDILETVVLAFALFIVVNVFVAQLHEVYGNSMLPDFKNGEYLLTDKVTYRFRNPQRGDVIIFKSPEPPHRDYIKRVIGLPGESVTISDGKVYIYNATHPQGYQLKEDYLEPGMVTEGKTAMPNQTKYTVPADSYVVFGDNRAVSSDSRTWGAVTKSEIIGRSLVRLWPPNSFSFIAHAKY
ncbi:MAG: signal peptidase I [Patescibacteria group bacterium]